MVAKNDDGSISILHFENHNARFALIEIVNIYKGLTFEPIHRIFNIQGKPHWICSKNLTAKLLIVQCWRNRKKCAFIKSLLGFVWKDTKTAKTVYKCVETNITDLAVSHLQPILDQYLNENANESEIDYIHGSDEVFRLGEKDNTVSILLPPIAKDSFFATIVRNGPLPRKSFSMGEASEKRFYMECRKLF